MIALCKKNYIHWEVEKYFKKDKIYKYKNIEYWFHDKNGKWEKTTNSVYYNKNIYINFTNYDFEQYFYSEKEIRKLKIEKLNEKWR